MATSAAGNPRLLLRRLRDIMQERTSAQDAEAKTEIMQKAIADLVA